MPSKSPSEFRVDVPSHGTTTAVVYSADAAVKDQPRPLLILAHGAGAGQRSPFIVDFARGAINDKGPNRFFLNACESILAVNGKLPVNIMFTCDGEEEQVEEDVADRLGDVADEPLNGGAVDRAAVDQGVNGAADCSPEDQAGQDARVRNRLSRGHGGGW